ncbi:YihY/virulence factor BrkB family protein [Nesterenkonia alkaliphila]|uniref:YihY family inner membrane protein n=1 Tax=Nesterenkonia alkaliphila TaxID=1463631 RepID=A0A7K1UFP3_9MICC|nr:YihY/virulence factor BrkB family protein [Nesterenkonia alkaliphila]MVT25290.1 YihY family inner membrane protein [Nesterenkonia alkaliphila]GFZ81848.1 ribonuclease [Nesterenkonia alkaliphila]
MRSDQNPADQPGLTPHQLREQQVEAQDSLGGEVTYEDSARPGTVSAAADQPYLVKARQRQEYAEEDGAEHGKKAESPVKLTGTTWKYSFKRAAAEFGRDQCTDMAAALTYYTVLSIFPALIALVSILGLVGEADRVTGFFVDMVADLTGNDRAIMDTVNTVVGNITGVGGAGLGLAVGILLALWTASNYVNAFSRAMNRIWEVEEGRSFIQLRPMLYGITVAMILLVAIGGVTLVVSGPVAEAIGNVIGLGETFVTIWNWATPFVMIIVAAIAIGLLYFFTPNIRRPGPKWITPGATITIVAMIITTLAVAIYVMNFANYEATYGALASVIIFLFWVNIMNMVLLFGAELDSELERGRQLQAGIEAERTIMLPLRQTKGLEKKNSKYEKLVAAAQALRQSEGETSDPEQLWRR